MSADRIWELMGRKLSNEASAEELQELDHLLRTHADLHFSVQTITDLWQQDNNITSADETQAAFDQHLQRMAQKGITLNRELHEPEPEAAWQLENPHKKVRTYKVWTISVAALLLLAAWWYFVFAPKSSASTAPVPIAASVKPGEISTQYGSRTTQRLPDGSRVWLNAGSKLTFGENFGDNIREVTLTGEAFFDVVKNPAKPFVIHTSTIDVKVLGTQFNVKSYPSDKTTETSLIRGSVEVVVKNRPNEKYVLKPNEKLVVLNDQQPVKAVPSNNYGGAGRLLNRDNLIAIKNLTYQQGDTSDIESAWIRNKLSVKNMPFVEMAKIMERWYDVRFEFRNQKLEDLWITGSFDNETLTQALEALQFSFAFNYDINDKTVIVY
jgi:ferric-dicitrate binding protein FerR (iron transport regulator)